jgi:hypothetical protein
MGSPLGGGQTPMEGASGPCGVARHQTLGGAAGQRGAHLVEVLPPPPPLYKEVAAPPLIPIPSAFSSLSPSPSRMVPKYWSVHVGFEISTTRTTSCSWILGPDLSSSIATLDRSPRDVVFIVRV